MLFFCSREFQTKKKKIARKKKYERKNTTETLRDVFLLHATTLLLSLVASRERERERERDLREVSLTTTRSNARARDKRGQEETLSPKRRTTWFCLFVCSFFLVQREERGLLCRKRSTRGRRRRRRLFFCDERLYDVFLERHKNTRDDFPP